MQKDWLFSLKLLVCVHLKKESRSRMGWHWGVKDGLFVLHFNCCSCSRQMSLICASAFGFLSLNKLLFVCLTKHFMQFILKQFLFALRRWFNMMKQESLFFFLLLDYFFKLTFLILEYNLRHYFFTFIKKVIISQSICTLTWV